MNIHFIQHEVFEALGAPFEHSPEKEIGIFPIALTEAGLADEKIEHFGSSLLVGHWHNDMPGLMKSETATLPK